MHASPAELTIPQIPYVEAIDQMSRLHEAGQTEVERVNPVGHGLPTLVGPRHEAPDLMSAKESPYGVPVRLAIDSSTEPNAETFFVLDIRDVQPAHIGGGVWARKLKNGVNITSPDVTHLLVNRKFGEGDSEVPGFKGLRPGESIEIGRHSPDQRSRKIMAERFGLRGANGHSLISRQHATVTLAASGEDISVVDLNSKFGTYVTTRKQPEAGPRYPARAHRGRRVARAAIGWARGGAQHGFLDHGGNEL